MEEFASYLQQIFLSTNNEIRKDAENKLNEFSQKNFESFFNLFEMLLLSPTIQADSIKNQLYPHMLNSFQSNNTFDIFAGILLLECLICTMSNPNSTIFLIKELYPNIMEILNKLLYFSSQNFINLSNKILQFNQNAQEELKTMSIELNISVFNLEAINLLYDILISVYKNINEKMTKTLCFSEIFLSTLFKSLSLLLITNKQIKDCFFSTSGLHSIDENLNEIKSKTLDLYSKLINFTDNNNEYNPLLINIIELTNKSLIIFFNQSSINFQQFIANRKNENFLISIFKFFNKCLNHSILSETFANFRSDLIFKILFPVLSISSREMDYRNNSPEDFVATAIDACDQQISDSYKSVGAQTLDILCKSNELALISLIDFINNLIEMCLNNNACTNQEFIKIYSESNFFKNCSCEVKVETSFLIIAILNGLIRKKKILLKKIEKIFIEKIDLFINQNNSNLIKCRLVLVLGYYIDLFFNSNEMVLTYQAYLDFLLDSLVSEDLNLSYQTIECFNNLVAEEDYKKLNFFISNIFTKIIPLISFIEYLQFFDLIQDLIKLFAKKLITYEDIHYQMVTAIINRLIKDLNKNNTNQNSIIIKCFNILKIFADQKFYICSKGFSTIENELIPIYNFLKKENFIYIDDVISLISTILRTKKQVTQNLSFILYDIIDIFRFKEKIIENLFSILNYFVIYGNDIFLASVSNLEIVLKIFKLFLKLKVLNIGLEALLITGGKSTEFNNSEGALLLQLIIQNYSDLLNFNHLELITLKTVEKIQNYHIRNNFLKASLAGIFISFFSCKFSTIMQILEKHNLFLYVIEYILNQNQIYSNSYERKVFVIGLSSLIYKEEENEKFRDRLSIIIENMILFLMMQKMQEKMEKKEKTMTAKCLEDLLRFSEQEINNSTDPFLDEIASSDADSDDFIFTNENPEYELNTLIEKMVTKIKDMDEFEYFRCAFSELKKRNPSNFEKIINSLSEINKKYLQEIFLTQRIVINQDSTNKSEVRKIVKISGKKKLDQ